ncbi:MAG: PEP/pyruvate-binding domain-containing protein [Methylovirgula sp.]|uniref:PEP/pyruvate-binding domain-containing protein n=1 Tax=Methylovirgula sp. TaxID=1978224 RepID=UPI003076175D
MTILFIGDGSTTLYPADVVGAKAANLAHMAALGLPVPPAFILPVELCAAITKGEPGARKTMVEGLDAGLKFLERATGRIFGDRRRPLLVSVRSGAARSMPGMLDTVLDVGCVPAAVRGLIRMTGNPHFAYDCRRRFLESYGDVVLGIEAALFAVPLASLAAAEDEAQEQDLDSEALERLAATYQQIVEDHGSCADDPRDDLKAAAEAVYMSWMSERACAYRKIEHLEDLQGTAVTVQAMVFGNYNVRSGAGVAFSRNPSTGDAEPVIDVLFGSQGEDVVSGRRNPQSEDAITRLLPAVDAELRTALKRLEQEFRDVQDVEFTIEDGKLWLLQTRSAKRTPRAAVRFAIDFVKEGLIAPAEALQRLDGVDLTRLAHQKLVDAGAPVARGVGAAAGIATGRVAFDSPSATRLAADGDPVILVRPNISTADVSGFAAGAGILAAVGGRTAHAALVARQLGKPCIVGCSELEVDPSHQKARIAGNDIHEGDWLSIDGGTGEIYLGHGQISTEESKAELDEIARWKNATALQERA